MASIFSCRIWVARMFSREIWMTANPWERPKYRLTIITDMIITPIMTSGRVNAARFAAILRLLNGVILMFNLNTAHALLVPYQNHEDSVLNPARDYSAHGGHMNPSAAG